MGILNGDQQLNNQAADNKTIPLKKKFVESLGFLRGIAALSVCFYHFTSGALPKLQDPRIEALFSKGWAGVDIFFVISGFIIPYSLLGKGYSVRKFFSYMKKRIIRINPPSYIALGLILAQWYFIDHFISNDTKYTGDLSIMQLVHNVLFTIPFTNYKWIMPIFWTLAIEFQFYIFIGLLFNVIYEKFNIFTFVFVFLCAAVLQYLPFESRENFFRYSALFALGGVSLLYHESRIGVKIYISLLILFFVIAWVQILPIIAIVGTTTAVFINLFSVRNKIADFFGKISYSLYLVHVLVGTTCEFFLVRIINPEPFINKVIMLFISVVIAVGCAYVFYLTVEKRFMKMANKN